MTEKLPENQAAKSVDSIDWLELKSSDGLSSIEFFDGEIEAFVHSHNIDSVGNLSLDHKETRRLYEVMRKYYSNGQD